MVQVSEVLKVLYVIATATILLFTIASFVFNYGQKSSPRLPGSGETALRLVGKSVVAISYIIEIALISLNRDEITADRLVAAVFYGLAWFAHLRKTFLFPGTLGLTSITLGFAIPILVLNAVYHGAAAEYAALLTIASIRLLIVASFLVDYIASREKTFGREDTVPLINEENGEPTTSQASYGTEPVLSRSASGEGYFSSEGDGGCDSDGDDSDEDSGRRDSRIGQLRKRGNWTIYLNKFKVFLPCLIPKRDLKVQACLFTCVLCLIANRLLNILVPRQLGIVTDKLLSRQLPYADLFIYLILSLLHDDSGVGLIEALSKIPVEQFSYRQLTSTAFNHVMSLAMEFHSGRDSAEIMKAIEQGDSLTRVLETAILQILPTIVDMFIAFVFLYLKFNPSVAICMLFSSLMFFSLEVITSGWNIDNRRRMTKAQRQEARVMHQAVQGWQTVSLFSMFDHEKFKFGCAVDRHLIAKKDWSTRDAYIKALTEAMMPITFFLLACLVAHEVYEGHASPGDLVFLIQYWEYLVWPIKFLSHEYRYLMSDLVDAERLLDLLTTKSTVADRDGAPDLGAVEGAVEFEHVNFTYDSKRTAVGDVSISAAPGETIALVGATGSGKSSLMKLLLRFYDVTSGHIKVDGHDIRDVTQRSLRDVIGVVPQNPLLFNTTIMENLRYAKLSASDEEIYNACRAAAIHDNILTFPEGYNTQVGELGVKLSGGELQRLAIARVFLKDPPILILDEATSAVDTETESEIQCALKKLSRKRTTFIIAHRLSTIVRANEILVLQDGKVIERGTHNGLLERGERYHTLWQNQFIYSKE
ncbi:abc transporter [Histoplasma capsulatum var. duboisii H88]|uniref:Abc transporter n=1 Tax=Ajellomyces capsulatus (strain H88) TaxID=544711 RepID=A0A8A1LY72_AJEC8|nr:abc transporter [Histoplasma capsulatum var. duboisii H88]